MKVVFFTGAGVSVASGLRPFRGPDGLYSTAEAERLSHRDTLKRDPDAVWEFWGGMRAQAVAAEPNAAHLAIAEVEKRLGPDDEVTVITMNVDGLHQKAGSTNVIELHGSLLHSRCTGGEVAPFFDTAANQDRSPYCNQGHLVRPDIVLFGETPRRWSEASKAAYYSDVFVTVGTSMQVSPANKLPRRPFYRGFKTGGRTYFVNPELPEGLRWFHHRIRGTAEAILPVLLKNLVPGVDASV